MYRISKGQLWVIRVVVIITALALWFVSLDSYGNGAFYFVSAILVIGIYIFYDIGWRNVNKKPRPPKEPKPELNDEEKSYLKKWSWGATFFGFWWALFSRIPLYALLYLIPLINIFLIFYYGKHGKRISWEKGVWKSFDEFKKRQRVLDIISKVWVSAVIIAIVSIAVFPWIQSVKEKTKGVDKVSGEKQYEAYAVGDDNYPILVMPIDEGVTSTDLNDDNIKDIVLKNPKDDGRLSPYIYNFMVLEANGNRETVKIFNKLGKYETNIETSHSDNCTVKDINLLDTLDMGKLLVLAERFPDTKSNGQVDFSFFKLTLENNLHIYKYYGHIASKNKYCDVNDGLKKELPQAFETARNINIFEPTPKPTPQLRTKTPTPKPTPDPNAEILKQLKISDLDRAMDVMYENLMGNIKLINSSPSQYCNTLSKYNPDHAYYLFTSFISQMHTKYDADASYIPEMAIKLAALDKYPNQIIQRCYDYGYYPTP